jgi:ComF family protein
MTQLAERQITALAEISRSLIDSLLPKRCPLCSRVLNRSCGYQGFCDSCQPLLPWIISGCEICGAELHEVGVCGNCQSSPPDYDHSVIPFHYSEPVSGKIQALKYHDQLQFSSTLGDMICRRVWQDPYPFPQLLIPVPLHRNRLRQRGFNQALEIARVVGSQLGIAVNHLLLERIRDTASQTGLGEAERASNLHRAFTATCLPGLAHVALVDDVVTSGSTTNAAARALKQAGVGTVSIWAVART